MNISSNSTNFRTYFRIVGYQWRIWPITIFSTCAPKSTIRPTQGEFGSKSIIDPTKPKLFHRGIRLRAQGTPLQHAKRARQSHISYRNKAQSTHNYIARPHEGLHGVPIPFLRLYIPCRLRGSTAARARLSTACRAACFDTAHCLIHRAWCHRNEFEMVKCYLRHILSQILDFAIFGKFQKSRFGSCFGLLWTPPWRFSDSPRRAVSKNVVNVKFGPTLIDVSALFRRLNQLLSKHVP